MEWNLQLLFWFLFYSLKNKGTLWDGKVQYLSFLTQYILMLPGNDACIVTPSRSRAECQKDLCAGKETAHRFSCEYLKQPRSWEDLRQLWTSGENFFFLGFAIRFLQQKCLMLDVITRLLFGVGLAISCHVLQVTSSAIESKKIFLHVFHIIFEFLWAIKKKKLRLKKQISLI